MSTGRYKLFFSIGLFILLSLLSGLFLLFSQSQSPAIRFFCAIIILLALISVIVVYGSVKRTERRISMLPDDYKKAFLDLREYIGLSAMNSAMKRETVAMILEIFEHAALEDRDIDEVTGGDLELFMKDFITAAGGNPSFLYWFSFSSLIYIGYLLLMKFYKVFRTGELTVERFRTESLDLGIALTYALIAYLFFPWLMVWNKKAAKEQWRGIKKGLLMIPFSIPFGLVSLLLFLDNERLKAFLDTPFLLPNSLYQFIVGCVLFCGFAVLLKKSRKQGLRK